MKKLLLIMICFRPLFSFDFDFSLPPVFEEVFEPSVLGDEVQPQRVEKPQAQPRRQMPTSVPEKQSEPSTIYVEHKESIDLSPSSEIAYPSYPKIALLVPKKVIGKYANSIADSIFSYLIFKGDTFQFELFDSKDESEANIKQTLGDIKAKGYPLVIAAVTKAGAQVIANHEGSLQVYIPTINKKEIDLKQENIFFGGIDYEEQIDKLLTHSGESVAIFGDPSALSKKLELYVDNASFSDISYRKTIENAKANLTPFIKKNKALEHASIFLNMPIVKSSLLASQLNVHDVAYKNILLTQISYHPLLFILTQAQDRSKMFLANSITHSDAKLKDINLIMGVNLDFSWVNYSTLIGVDYLLHRFIDDSEGRYFVEKMVNNQIKYAINILKPQDASFMPVKDAF